MRCAWSWPPTHLVVTYTHTHTALMGCWMCFVARRRHRAHCCCYDARCNSISYTHEKNASISKSVLCMAWARCITIQVMCTFTLTVWSMSAHSKCKTFSAYSLQWEKCLLECSRNGWKKSRAQSILRYHRAPNLPILSITMQTMFPYKNTFKHMFWPYLLCIYKLAMARERAHSNTIPIINNHVCAQLHALTSNALSILSTPMSSLCHFTPEMSSHSNSVRTNSAPNLWLSRLLFLLFVFQTGHGHYNAVYSA